MPKFTGNFKTIIDLGSLIGSDGKIPNEVQVFPSGSFNTQPYGTLVFNDGIFDQMVANFQNKVRKAVPIDVDHDGGKAAGWIKGLVNKGSEGLWATVEWTKMGKELLGEKIYKLFSPEWNFDYVDPQNSTRHGSVLIAGSLTNRPLFRDLKALMASENSEKGLTNNSDVAIIILEADNKSASETKTMNIKDILAKAIADRSAKEIAFLKANLSKMTDDQKALFEKQNKKKASEDGDGESETDAEKTAREEKEAKDAKAAKEKKAQEDADAKAKADKEAKDKIANDKDVVTMTASEVKELKKAQTELNTMKAKEAVGKIVQPLIANEEGGKILPKDKTKVTDFLLTCSDEQKDAFVALMGSMADQKVVGKISDDADTAGMPVQDQLKVQAKKLMKADSTLDYHKALTKVNKDPKNKELIASIN